MRSDLANAIRRALTDSRDVCERLGLAHGPRSVTRQSRGVLIRCPWHEENTPSCSVTRGADGTIRARCHGCGQSGDLLSLLAAVHGLDVRRDFRQVLRHGAELAGISDVEEVPYAPRERASEQPTALREYPPLEEVREVWNQAGFVACEADVRDVLQSRGLDVEAIDDRALARVLPQDAVLPNWARIGDRSWAESGHRLVLPVYDAQGAMRSLRAWYIGRGDAPKRLPPRGCAATGLVLADPFAITLLRAGARVDGMPDPLRLVIVEGEPDFLTWATGFSDADESAPLVLGVVSGSWNSQFAGRIPDGAYVVLRTDHDDAGDRYATEIARTLSSRCTVHRARPSHP